MLAILAVYVLSLAFMKLIFIMNCFYREPSAVIIAFIQPEPSYFSIGFSACVDVFD